MIIFYILRQSAGMPVIWEKYDGPFSFLGKSVSGVRNITFLSYQIHQCTAHARSAGGLDGRVLMDKDSDPFAQLSEDVCLRHLRHLCHLYSSSSLPIVLDF